MRINKCWFCSANIYPGHDSSFVRNDATVFKFCRAKCYKLFKKRLNPRKIKWTKICRHINNKELADDKVLTFEKRVHEPAMYDREAVLSTVEAIPKILGIRQRREDTFIKERILKAKEEQKDRDIAFIERHERLLEKDDTVAKPIQQMKKKEKEVQFN